MVLSISNHNLHSYNMGFLCISLFLELHLWKTKSRHDSSRQSPKINPAKQKKQCPAISTRLLLFHYFEVNIVLWKEKVYQIRSPFMQLYSVYRDTCMYKTFVKATTSNTSKLRAVFCMGQYKKSRKYFIALECKN